MEALAPVQIKLDASEVRRLLKSIPNAENRAVARGLNKAIRLVRTQSVRAIANERALRQKDIRGSMYMQLAKPNIFKLNAILHITGRPITLKGYGAQVVGQRGRGKKKKTGPGASPVSVEVIKGQRKIVKGAFVGPNGHIYKRRGTLRNPIKKLYGPSLPTAFVKPVVEQQMRRVAMERTPELIENELYWELRRAR